MTIFDMPVKREKKLIYDVNGFYIGEAFDEKAAEFIITAVNAYEANQALIKQLVEALNEARSEILQLKNARWSEAEGSDDDWVAGYDEALDAARKAGF